MVFSLEVVTLPRGQRTNLRGHEIVNRIRKKRNKVLPLKIMFTLSGWFYLFMRDRKTALRCATKVHGRKHRQQGHVLCNIMTLFSKYLSFSL